MKTILLILIGLSLFIDVAYSQNSCTPGQVTNCQYIVKDVTNYTRYGSNEGNLMITPSYTVCSHTTHYHTWRITDSEGKVVIERDKDGLGGFGLGWFKPGNYKISGSFHFIGIFTSNGGVDAQCGPPTASFSITEPPLDLTFSSTSKDVTAADCRSGSITTKIILDSWVNWKVNLLDSTKKVISSFKGKYYTYNGPYTKRVIDFPSVKNYTFDTLSAGTYRLELLADTCGEDGWRAQGQRIYPEYYENFDNCIAGSPYQEPNYTVIDSAKVIIKGPKCEIPVRVVDPNPLLVKEDGTLSTDVTEANKLKTEVKGAATDGVTKLLLIAETEKPVRFEIKGTKQGTLSNLDGTVLTPITDLPITKDKEGKGFVVAVYTVPDGYGSEFAPGGRDVVVTVSEKDIPSNAKEVKIRLVTPPVVLVHGMWSDPNVWESGKTNNGFRTYLNAFSFKIAENQRANYSAFNHITFDPQSFISLPGRAAVEDAIKNSLTNYHNDGIAATQVDVVGHSLGGLMTRSFVQQDENLDKVNYRKGFVHKLITLGTPHLGTPIGKLLWDHQSDILRKNITDPQSGVVIGHIDFTVGEIFAYAGKRVGTCHHDFDPNISKNYAFQNLNETVVKSHAIITKWSPGANGSYAGFSLLVKLLVNKNLDSLYDYKDNDLIVVESSQTGTLTGTNFTEFQSTTHAAIPVFGMLDDTQTTNSFLMLTVKNLLLTDDAKYFAASFPKPVLSKSGRIASDETNSTNAEKTIPLGDASKGTEGLQITFPQRGAVYNQNTNATIKVNIKENGGAVISDALIMVQDIGLYEMPKKPPYEITFTLPAQSPIGKINIIAVARDKTGVLIVDTTHIVIKAMLSLFNLAVMPSTLKLDSIQRQSSFFVSGNFKIGQDTIYSNLTNTASGTTYKTLKGNSIITIDGSGVVTAIKAGTDVVEIKNGTQIRTIPVTVDANFAQAFYRNNAITFDKIIEKIYGNAPFVLKATATSDEKVTFSIVSGPATVTENGIVTLTGAGTVIIKASQTGNTYYKAAADVTQTFAVKKASQTIAFNTVDNKTFGDIPFIVSASVNSQLPVTFIYVSGPAKLDGNKITITDAGTVVIRGVQAGNFNYEAAHADLSISVAKAAATIGINPFSVIYDGTSKSISFNTSPAGLPVTVTYAGSNIAPVNAGTYAVVAKINHPSYTGAANSTLTIAKANQTLIFASLSNKTYGDPAFNLSATSNSGLTATYSIVEGATYATLNGAQLTITGVGQVTIRVTQPGTENYNAAIPVERTFTIAKANQTIVFNALTDKTFGDGPFILAASASSTLPVSFSKVSGPITLDGEKVTITGAGSVTLRALQAGNATYNVAPNVDRIFVVGKANQTITFDAIEDKIANDSSFTLTAITTSGLLVSFKKVSGPVNLFGNTVVISGPGKAIIRASQAGESNYNSAPDVERSFIINAVTGLEAQLEKQIKIYPNPASTQVIIKFPLTIQWQGIILTSIQGKQVEDIEEKPTQNVILGVGHLARGMYILEIRTSQGIIHKRLVVE